MKHLRIRKHQNSVEDKKQKPLIGFLNSILKLEEFNSKRQAKTRETEIGPENNKLIKKRQQA